jgi:CAAX prenyl protease-like protein
MRITVTDSEARWAVARHIVPFIIWVVVMSLPMSDVALRYALQTVICLVALLILKPWRYYPALNIRLLPLSVLVGVGVAVLWILPESGWIKQWPAIHDGYARYFIRGSDPGNGQLYAPEQCGWSFSIIRLCGSAFVIAVLEEFFWRGFFMRWMANPNFLAVEPRKVGWRIFIIIAIAFGFEHSRWLAGMLAGLAYGGLYLRKGDLMAVAVAHVTTNYLLGLYVLATGAYHFW